MGEARRSFPARDRARRDRRSALVEHHSRGIWSGCGSPGALREDPVARPEGTPFPHWGFSHQNSSRDDHVRRMSRTHDCRDPWGGFRRSFRARAHHGSLGCRSHVAIRTSRAPTRAHSWIRRHSSAAQESGESPCQRSSAHRKNDGSGARLRNGTRHAARRRRPGTRHCPRDCPPTHQAGSFGSRGREGVRQTFASRRARA